MSWLFSRALVEASWVRKNSESKQSAPLNWICAADVFWYSDRTRGTLETHSQYGMIFVPLSVGHGRVELTSYLEGFPAKRLVPLLGGETQQKTFGLKCGESWRLLLPTTSLLRTSVSGQLTKQQRICAQWVIKPRCLPFLRETWVLTTFGKDTGYLHTPTTKANYAAPSMQKWPSSRSFVQVFGRPTPGNQEWMMGWPQGWSDTKPLGTGRFQSWRQQLCGHLQMLRLYQANYENLVTQAPRTRHQEVPQNLPN